MSRMNCTVLLAILFSVLPLVASAQGAVNEVYLDDRESHSWSYYSDSTCLVRSLNPADVRIRYFGYGTNTMYSSTAAEPTGSPDVSVASGNVGIGIDAPGKNTYVYYKTLERVNGEQAVSVAAADGPCFYRLIPNPYSLRPTYGSGDTRWRGFYRWRLKALGGGAIYRDTAMTVAVPVGTMLEAEDTVYFMPAAEYGMEVDFEAIWARAFVYPTILQLDQAAEGTYATGENAYERNFVVHGTGADRRWERDQTQPVKDFTITAVYPNGTDGTSSTLLFAVPNTSNLFDNDGWTSPAKNNSALFFLPWETIKFEYVKQSCTGEWRQWTDINGGRLVCGRMCLPEDGKIGFLFDQGRQRYLRCLSTSQLNNTRNKKCRWRIESGDFARCFYFGYAESNLSPQMSGMMSVDVVLGSDYDRSLGDNSKLELSIPRGTRCVFMDAGNMGTRQMNYVIKSGMVTGKYNDNVFGIVVNIGHGHNPKYCGSTTVVVEGGILPDIGCGHDRNPGDPTYLDTTLVQVRLYMKGGRVEKSIWGGGNRSDGIGGRRMVFTGGEINGWIAGGCNGTDPQYGGIVQGDMGIYFGGHAILQHNQSDPLYWYSKGGNLYGAGSGYGSDHPTIGKVNNSYVVLADSAYVSRSVYGGGNRGFCNESANVQILGGTVAGKVFGGSNQKFGRAVNVEMRGGHVLGGIHGGSNAYGEVSGPVSIHVEGGTIGEPGCHDTVGNIFGGGYGGRTSMTGTVQVVVGREDAKRPHVNNPLVHGNVYGGGFGGTVTTPSLKVTTHNGRIEKSVFGGGYGKTAVVTANPEVSILGTTHVQGNVYGGGNMGKVSGNTRVVIGD